MALPMDPAPALLVAALLPAGLSPTCSETPAAPELAATSGRPSQTYIPTPAANSAAAAADRVQENFGSGPMPGMERSHGSSTNRAATALRAPMKNQSAAISNPDMT